MDALRCAPVKRVEKPVSHTPGPYVAVDGDIFTERKHKPIVATCVDGDTGTALGSGITIQEAYATAQLLAAAPELLDALQELQRESVAAAERAGKTWPASPVAQKLYDKVEAAIRKATGAL